MSYNCTDNSLCVNVEGGYTCNCKTGYQQSVQNCISEYNCYRRLGIISEHNLLQASERF